MYRSKDQGKPKISVKLTEKQFKLLNDAKTATGTSYVELIRECIDRSSEYLKKLSK